ncbi:GntR family transcriptional regulator [Lactobacillus xylocopicola]|uniref:GntR family transcriptional regulator n=1 Tax=Lactobacillus xylocopicola TaxID=2976676 RepID=A0ABM8BFS6_9LACO|nr:GntR family transcriptional regulator [Lactobacillus xylocopicola]BDR60069.1 GntR family transcriptional regulator [Lactobacillus xylocopicola]
MARTGSLYFQVMEQIRQNIITGKYPVNSKLPNEFELSEQFNVSRVTLRKAIKGLTDDGLVEKIQGVGTFVRKPRKVKRIISSSHAESFSQTALNEGFKASAKVIESKEIKTPNKLKELFKTSKTLFIERVHLVDEEPIMLERNYFPLPRFAELEKADLSKSLYEALKKRYQIKKLTADDMIISVSLANQDEAKQLKKSIGFPLLLVQVSVKDENEQIVHAGKQYIVSDRYEFHL